jgi:hypothetical protein
MSDLNTNSVHTPTKTAVDANSVKTTGADQPVFTPEEKTAIHKEIKANFNNKVDIIETAFHFRKSVDKETKIETKRNSVVLPLPVPSVEGITDILTTGGKGLELLQEVIADYIASKAREYVNDNEDVSSTNFPFATLNWETIANLPKADRRGNGISETVWKEFAADYITVMPALINKSLDAVTQATQIFLTKFARIKTNKPILSKLREYLVIYLNNTQNGEQFADCVEFLDKKITAFLSVSEEDLLNAL